jgi:uncharacterized caspase-like protein
MENKLANFAIVARKADAALIFYAGHGIQHNGVNYLVPIDGQLENETDLRRFIDVRDILHDLKNSNGAKILILDACRDNEVLSQLAASLPKTISAAFDKGLAAEKAQGVLIAFAAQPDAVAADGLPNSRNSPFTQALLTHLKNPKIKLRTLLTRVRAEVYKATDEFQLPETSDSMIGEFRFQLEESAEKTTVLRVNNKTTNRRPMECIGCRKVTARDAVPTKVVSLAHLDPMTHIENRCNICAGSA